MTSLVATAVLEAAVALVVALAALAVAPLEAAPGVLAGVGLASVCGVGALALKWNATRASGAAAELQAVMLAQGLAIGGRVLVLLLGGLVLKRLGVEPTAYLLAFFVCAALHQVLELRYILAARPVAAPSKVSMT